MSKKIFLNIEMFEIMWGKYSRGRQVTDDIMTWRMRFACWIHKATNRRSEYVIVTAFPPQQWLHERASVLRLYLRCLSYYVCPQSLQGRNRKYQI